jgi:hypothetical protein
MKWHAKQTPGTLITMEVTFELLQEDIRLVIADPMDIAAEVRATTATYVALKIQKEIGQHRRFKISQVMRSLNNAIEIREALDDGRGVMDSFSRCEFWIHAYTGAKGQPENHCLSRMREQCQWTKNERGIDVQQRDPYVMEEQLAKSSYYWDKFAATIGSNPEEQREPFAKHQKTQQGGKREATRDRRGPEGFKQGRPTRESNPRKDFKERPPPSTRPSRAGPGDADMRDRNSGGSLEWPNPIQQKDWTMKPTYFDGSCTWVNSSIKESRLSLKNANKCFVCKAEHTVTDCPNRASKFQAKKFCYFKNPD